MTFLTAALILFLWSIPTVKVTKYFGFFCRSCRFHNLWNSHKLGSWFTSQSIKGQMWKFMALWTSCSKIYTHMQFFTRKVLNPLPPPKPSFPISLLQKHDLPLNPIQHAYTKGNSMTYLKEQTFKKPKQLTLWCGQQKHYIDDDWFYWTWLIMIDAETFRILFSFISHWM